MSTMPPALDPLENALNSLERSVSGWDADERPALGGMIAAVRELLARFDPRRERAAAALAVVALKLLEELQAAGAVGPEVAVGAVGDLTAGLREALKSAAPTAAPARGRHGNEVVLSAPKAGAGLSLSLGVKQDQRIGEVLLQMRLLTQEQVDSVLAAQAAERGPKRLFGQIAVELGFLTEALLDSALRMQSRGRGQTPAAEPRDAWGASPL